MEPKPTLSPEPENVIAAPTPEAAIATPTPSPKVFTLLEEYKGFADKNPDVRGWIRQAVISKRSNGRTKRSFNGRESSA